MNTSDPLSNWALQLTLYSLDLKTGNVYPVFVLVMLIYVAILFCNTVVFATIVFTKSLHKPMFMLLLNLPIMDIIGTTAFLPQLLHSIVTKNRSISYPGCFFQALLVHFYGGGNLFFLTAMAYDRYVAICLPLRYNSIMTQNTLKRIITSLWFMDLLFFTVLFNLGARFRICRTQIEDIFCNNPAMTKLLCADTTVNNYFGLAFIGVLQGGPLIIVTYTYIQILLTCMSKKSDARGKALQTCGTHLVVFLFFQFNSAITLVAHRFQSVSPYLRRALGVSIMIFPPILNPLIYGLNTKELQKSVIQMLKRVGLRLGYK